MRRVEEARCLELEVRKKELSQLRAAKENRSKEMQELRREALDRLLRIEEAVVSRRV